MAAGTFNFTTGPTQLPDVGTLNYNGCIFSPLFETKVSGTAVKDEANRTVKYMEYTITVDGYVTLPDGAVDISNSMATLRQLLTDQGGALIYRGRGCDIVVNSAGPGGVALRDVVWGPSPELLEFQPLGHGRSAKIQWQVKVHIPERVPSNSGRGGLAATPLLQFNYETEVSYNEDGYSALSIKGVLEIPMTRSPNQKTRTLAQTADNFRKTIEDRIMPGIDLTLFRVTRRNFSLSRDKRTLNWDFSLEEKPYMDLPPGCTIARGTYTVRPAKSGMGLATWLCTLRATYTVRADRPRRTAWMEFLTLLKLRMKQSVVVDYNERAAKLEDLKKRLAQLKTPNFTDLVNPFSGEYAMHEARKKAIRDEINSIRLTPKVFILDFSFDEGMYLDSKTTSFSATWRLNAYFHTILIASGLWKKVPEKDSKGNNLWKISMQNIEKNVCGSQSWLLNQADPALDVIVDFGS